MRSWTLPRSHLVDRVADGSVILAAMLAAFSVPFLYVASPRIGLAYAGVYLLVAALAIHKAFFAILAVPAVLAVQRAGGAISVSDLVLTAAAATAVAGGVPKRLSPPAATTMRALGVFLLLLLPSVAANLGPTGVLEWLHRIVLVGGGILVGVWIVELDRQRLALRLLLAGMAGLAVAAILTAANTGFQAAYPLGYHKNFVGSVLASTLLVLLVAPRSFALSRPVQVLSVLALLGGLLASQSRGGMLAVVVGSAVWVLRSEAGQRRRLLPVIAVIAVGLGTLAWNSVQEQLVSGDQHSSLEQRFDVEAQTRALWEEEPLLGVGLRYYNTPQYEGYQPPNNVLNEALAESGVPGLLGLVVLVTGATVAAWRAQGALAVAATCVLLSRVAHGMVDIYWVAGTGTLPWLILGMGLASGARTTRGAACADAGEQAGTARAPEHSRPR